MQSRLRRVPTFPIARTKVFPQDQSFEQLSDVCNIVGGVVSPLISNVYLDAFDQEMKRRGHRIVRYADDILILCRTRSAADMLAT